MQERAEGRAGHWPHPSPYRPLWYYPIISDDGPVLASTVTYLLPVVAVIFGALVLDEPITLQLAAGVAVVLAGVALTKRMSGVPADRP